MDPRKELLNILFPSFPLPFLSVCAPAAFTFTAVGKQPLSVSEEGCASLTEQCKGQNTKCCQVCRVNKLQSNNSLSSFCGFDLLVAVTEAAF